MSEEVAIFTPPITSECSPCRHHGHFCRGTRYLKPADPEDERAICESCATNQDCPTTAAIRQQDNPDAIGEPMVLEARVVPKEEWSEDDLTIKEQGVDMSAVPFGLKNEIREEKKGERQIPADKTQTLQLTYLKETFPTSAAFFETLSSFALNTVKYAAATAPATSWFVEEKVGEQWRMVIDHPIFFIDRDDARKLARKLSGSASDKQTRTMIWPKGTPPLVVHPETAVSRVDKMPTESVPGRRRGKGLFTHEGKRQAREQAKALLAAGATIGEVGGMVELSKKTIQDVREELGMVAKRNPQKSEETIVVASSPELGDKVNFNFSPEAAQAIDPEPNFYRIPNVRQDIPEDIPEPTPGPKPSFKPLLTPFAYAEIMRDIDARILQLENLRRTLKELQGES